MDFDILDIIEDATKEADAFENHPMCNIAMEEQLLYLNGLALVMNADGHIDDTEKEYIRILIKSIGLDESSLDDMVAFAKAPDKDTVQAFFRTFRRKPIAQLFLFDALMMTRRDGKVEEKEIAVVNKIADQLEILKGTQQDIFDLFCHIKNRNWQESALYFSSHLLNPEHFKHLLAYHEIGFDELMEETKGIRKIRLIEVLKPKLVDSLEWGAFACEGTSQNADYITKKPVTISSAISYELVLPWLQLMLDKGALRVSKESVYVIEDDEDVLLFNFAESLFIYEQEANVFYLKTTECAQKNVGAGSLLDNFLYYTDLDDLDGLMMLTGATGVALALPDGNLPTCDGKQVSVITSGHSFGDNGHPNAVLKLDTNNVDVRYCLHCKGGHGSVSKVCNDGDRRVTSISMNEMLSVHGFYLVK